MKRCAKSSFSTVNTERKWQFIHLSFSQATDFSIRAKTLAVKILTCNFFELLTADFLHICHKSDPNLIGCMKTSIETLRPSLIKGIPDLDIPSIEPMDIGNLLVSENTRSNGLHISAKNIVASGASTFRINKME